MTSTPPRSRRMLFGLAALFFAPLIGAWLLYNWFPQWVPQGKTHHGELIDPARPLPPLQLVDAQGAPADEALFRGRWSFVYLGGARCEAACADKLYQIRQIRTLLNEKRQRVQRVYVAPDAAALEQARAALAPQHPDLVFVVAPDGGAALRAFFGTHDPQALYLTDPHANFLMVYPATSDSPGILKDIQRLLRLSQIG